MNLQILLQHMLPHHWVAKLANNLANTQNAWIKNLLIKYFISQYSVNMNEAIQTDPLQYKSFNHFFTRQLKSNARTISNKPEAIISPADGLVSQIGQINKQKLLQAKGHSYCVQDLLAGNADLTRPFANGHFATIYLAPKDYHRIHMPLDGSLLKMVYVPGKLFSVNINTTENIPDLFARNERVICLFQTISGQVAIILVGAMIVGSIETLWAGKISPPHYKDIQTWNYKHDNNNHIALKKGDELGRFNLGSTVIVLFEKDKIQWSDNITEKTTVNMGQQIAHIL